MSRWKTKPAGVGATAMPANAGLLDATTIP
jgi:hypothetical protein